MSDYTQPSQKQLFGMLMAWLVALLIVVGAITLALWAFGVFTADIKGRGELVKTNKSAVNRIQKQEMFEQLYADLNGYKAKIGVARDAVEANPSDVNQTNLTGIRQQCIDTVQQYNAEARKITSRDWRSADLPDQQLNQEDYCT